MSEVIELKPCPFCGGEVAEITNAHELEDCASFESEGCPCELYEDSGFCSLYSIVCSMNRGGCGSSSGYFSTEEKAVEAWNRRYRNDREGSN